MRVEIALFMELFNLAFDPGISSEKHASAALRDAVRAISFQPEFTYSRGPYALFDLFRAV